MASPANATVSADVGRSTVESSASSPFGVTDSPSGSVSSTEPLSDASLSNEESENIRISLLGIDTPECSICHKWLNMPDKPRQTCPVCRSQAYRIVPPQKDIAIENAALYRIVEGERFESDDLALSALIATKLLKLDSAKVAPETELHSDQYIDCIISAVDYYLTKAQEYETEFPIHFSGVGSYSGLQEAVEKLKLRSSSIRKPFFEEEVAAAIKKVIFSDSALNVRISKRVGLANRMSSWCGPIDSNLQGDKRYTRRAKIMTRRLIYVLSSEFDHYPLWRPEVELLSSLDQDSLRRWKPDFRATHKDFNASEDFKAREDVDKDPSQFTFVKPFIERTLESWGITDVKVE
ncbi:uncharacterized protein KY384_005066 [Bacidia gigantensis]|uniref:uncharacterized protein n=1 Tax=Bacidia gigantensis TaxID=2732470 RepID=UPI001D04B3CA|nr:uncharacterized protein KY384_005066 [Bacidia gigantensis]KAG8530563.1 hypothetical protein KY384_005066 [Bacidia gigantensis]